VTHSTLLCVECVDTIKPSVSIQPSESKRFTSSVLLKNNYSLLVKKPELSGPRLILNSFGKSQVVAFIDKSGNAPHPTWWR